MIAHEAPVRWAANAPSAAVLAAMLRDELPSTRVERVLATRERLLDDGTPPDYWRIWPLTGPSLLFKRYPDGPEYRTEVCNLRFFNAVARDHTPRLLACDDAARALLIEDTDGASVAATEALGDLIAHRTWERVLVTVATIHARAARQMALLRRLYAPHWPAMTPVPTVAVLEDAVDMLLARQQQPPLSVSERGVLIAAGSWLHARLNVAHAHFRMPVLGVASIDGIIANASRVAFTELTRPVLGLQPADLVCTWRCVDRQALIEHCYLAERARLGVPIAPELFWELDAALIVAACAERLRRLARLDSERFEGLATDVAATGARLAQAAQHLSELQGAGALVERLLLR